MRKHLIVFAMALLVLLNSGFADTSAEGTSTDDSISSSLDVQFVIGGDGDKSGNFKIGFSDSATHTGANTTPIALDYKDEDNSVISNVGVTDGDVYVWWDIASAAAYSLELSIDDGLTGTKNTDQKIHVSIAGDSSSDIGTGETLISNMTSDGTTSFAIIDHEAGTMNTYSGHQKLIIESKKGQLDGKPSDTYKATLTLAIVAG